MYNNFKLHYLIRELFFFLDILLFTGAIFKLFILFFRQKKFNFQFSTKYIYFFSCAVAHNNKYWLINNYKYLKN